MIHEMLLLAVPPLVPILPTLKFLGNKMDRSPLVGLCLILVIFVGVLWQDNLQLREDRVNEQKERNKADAERHKEEIVRMSKYDVIYREMKDSQAALMSKEAELKELKATIAKTKKKGR